jgi:hypothetical protein
MKTFARTKDAAAEKNSRPASSQKISKNRVQLKKILKGLSYDDGMSVVSPDQNKKSVMKKDDVTPASKPDVVYKPGTFGMVTSATKAKSGTDEIALAAGNVVEVVEDKGHELNVKAWSGLDGIQVTMNEDVFMEEPGLTTYDHDKDASTPDVPRPYKYRDFTPGKSEDALTPGGKTPDVSDVSQGYIGDCYLMAGMGAVAAARPDLIQKMISYDEKTKLYTVTFKEKQGGGKFSDVKITVDAYLPVRSNTPQYAQTELTDPKDQAIWPAIIEKAYAKWKGGYQAIVGGVSGYAMEAMTGAQSTFPSIPDEKDVIKLFQGFMTDKKIVTVGTKDEEEGTSSKDFSGSAPGPYSAALKGSGTKAVEIVKNSLTVSDSGGKAKSASDDGKGKITGTDIKEGTVDYENGAVSLTYTSNDKSPAKAEDLQAQYRYEGLLSESLNVHGDHAYMFVKVEDDKIILANPWGPNPDYQPKPLTAKDFVTYFEGISVNAPLPKT